MGPKENWSSLRSSPFFHRNEGILVLKNKNTSDNSIHQNEEVFYSLGKQNRWMIPDVVKETNTTVDVDVGDIDFVLIEKHNARPRKDEVSLYSSGNGWKSLGKKSHMPLEVDNVAMTLEVTYPDSKGKKKTGSTLNCKPAKRQKHSFKQRKWTTDEYSSLDDVLFYYDDDLDSNDYHDDVDYSSPHTVNIQDYISHSMKASDEHSSKQCKDSNQDDNHDKETSESDDAPLLTSSERSTENKLIFIDDEHLAKKHRNNYDLLKERELMLDSIVCDTHNCVRDWCHPDYCYDRKGQRRRRLRWKHKKLSQIEETIEEHNTEEANLKPMSELPREISITEYKSSEVKLVAEDLQMSQLRKAWGESYLEGQSHPRKFTIKLTHPTTSLESAFILFELGDKLDQPTNQCDATIKLLLNNEMLKISEDTSQETIIDFCAAMDSCSDVISVEDIVSKAKTLISKCAEELNGKKIITLNRSTSLGLLESVKGWKGEAHDEVKAFAELKEEMDSASKKTDDHLCYHSPCSAGECGICFEELVTTDPRTHTMLIECGHQFCNSCYMMYVHTKLLNGQLDLVCPHHSCKVVIDSVTIMALAPALYFKYFSWKLQWHLVTSPSWKHCPSEKCDQVVKVTPTRDDDISSIPSRLPVSCGCKNIWCFDCQEQAHWPATCQQAKTFRASNTGYSTKKKVSYITSVNVRNCPSCKYPIEKHEGCPHMYCVMCDTSFCWDCLTVFNDDPYGGDCRCSDGNKIRSTQVDLALLMSDAERYASYALQSNCTVRAGLTRKMHQRVKSLDQGLVAFLSLKKVSQKFRTSNMGKILDNMIKNNVTEVLQKAYSFQLQASIAVEGMAIRVVHDSKSPCIDKCNILVYILEKLLEIVKNPLALQKCGNVERIKELIALGENVLLR